MVAPPPFLPTPIRAPVPSNPFPHPQQLMMVSPQQFNAYVYRGKQPFNKPARSQTYGGCEQGHSPPFISAAAATGSPIIAPGGTFPQQVYPIPSHQPVAYVQSPAGMVPQQIMQQGQATPCPAQSPLVYIPQVAPNASVPTSAASRILHTWNLPW
ncbi:hypothetical protein OS493_012498 [Desmophyllum pertusum]|uniref:Uncharacterized protein n=1 Tax=Desmophyllum pertusum TaxID=174260 RepID=A0A9W9ZQV6_9CNID|nr:hypothetical protein OS493_012498 [Desmophyllum pertusum]